MASSGLEKMTLCGVIEIAKLCSKLDYQNMADFSGDVIPQINERPL